MIFNMTYAGGTCLCHILAVLLWGVYSEVRFDHETSSEYDDDERVAVYGRSSPDMAIGGIVLLIVALIIFVLPHLRAKADHT